MFIIYLILLVVIVFTLCRFNNEPYCMLEVKKRYDTFLDYVNDTANKIPDKFKVLRRRILLSGYTRSMSGDLGWNSNKGDEISICIDGQPNQAFHILIHELAHSTVDEYNHSKEFWDNFEELRKLCEKIGIYTPIDNREKFCGRYIRD
jgi:hypothetical protein